MKTLPVYTLRECGDCTACCYAIPIRCDELDKGAFVDCSHLTGRHEHACSIRDARPSVCRDYECMWLQATNLQDDYRPDKLGLVFDGTHGSVGDKILGATGLLSTVAHEVWPGSSKEEFQQKVIRWFIDCFNCVVLVHRDDPDLIVYAPTPTIVEAVLTIVGNGVPG